MESSLRPWFTTGVALVGAGAIAIAPTTLQVAEKPPAITAYAPAPTSLVDVELTASEWPYILSLPIVRARVGSWLEEWAVFLGGFARSGIGLAESVAAIPGVTVEIVQQIVALDFVGAFNTFTTAVRDAVVAIGDPLLQSWIWRGQKAADQRSALFAAYPQAIIDVANGWLEAGSTVIDQAIVGTQEFIAAVLTFDIANIINTAVDGAEALVGAVGEGARLVIDGIESAQRAIAEAWQAGPPPPSSAAPPSVLAADAVPDLDGANVVTLNTSPAGVESPEPKVLRVDATPVSKEAGDAVDPEPDVAAPEPDVAPIGDETADTLAEVTLVTKQDRPTPGKDALNHVEKTVKRLKAGDAANKTGQRSVKKPGRSAAKTGKVKTSVGSGGHSAD